MEIELIFAEPSSKTFKGSIAKVFDNFVDDLVSNHDCHVNKVYLKSYGWWPITMLVNMLYYCYRSYRYKDRIFHITGDVHYLACLMNKRNTVLTIHDLVPLHNKNVPWHSRMLCYWLWYYFPLYHLKFITCISEATRNDLDSFFKGIESKIKVVPDSVGQGFKHSSKKFNSVCPRILHVGTRVNKNLDRVIKALDGVNCHLRIIGKLNNEQKELLANSAVDYSGSYQIPEEQIVKEYVECDIVSFPSLFEGFGMPIIEGQAVGRPVLTSNFEPMISVSGGAAILVDPTSVESIKDGFIRLIHNKELRESCVRKGLENAERFSSISIAKEYHSIYQKICTTC